MLAMLWLTANAATLNWANVNNAWNTTISGEDTLFEGNSNTSAGESTTIVNDDCKKYPEKCARTDTSNSTAWNWSMNSAKSNSAASSKSSSKKWTLSELPKTGPTENILILSSIIMASIIFIKRRKK